MTHVSGKLIYNPEQPHRCDPEDAKTIAYRAGETLATGAIWQCECGRYWLAKGYGTSGTMMWSDFRQRHLKKLAERHQNPPQTTKGMVAGHGPLPRVPPTVVCYREDVGMEQG